MSGGVDGDTSSSAYTRRLEQKESVAWKRWLNVQAPYRWNLRRLEPGLVLDVGCGIGRNLLHVDGNGVGIDHNAASVQVCRERGLEAYVPSEFWARHAAGHGWTFDSLLFAHVVEHMPFADACALVSEYFPLLRADGRGKLIFITPQEAGYRSDATHVEFVDVDGLRRLIDAVEGDDGPFRVTTSYSFPFPRPVGRVFPYNEFVVVAAGPARRSAHFGGTAAD